MVLTGLVANSEEGLTCGKTSQTAGAGATLGQLGTGWERRAGRACKEGLAVWSKGTEVRPKASSV